MDTDNRKVFVDIGNSFPIGAAGDFSDQGEVMLVAGSGPTALLLGSLNYRDKGSYVATAGVLQQKLTAGPNAGRFAGPRFRYVP